VTEADQLIAVFNALLMISRVEAGYSGQELTPIDLAAIAREIGELYEPVAEEAGIVLQVDAPGAAMVRGSRELVGQALTNLIDNAIKYAGRAPESECNPGFASGEQPPPLTPPLKGEGNDILTVAAELADTVKVGESQGPALAVPLPLEGVRRTGETVGSPQEGWGYPNRTASRESGEKARICLTVRHASDACEISVEDNGPGIAEADRERVLERFVRLDESRSKPGSGLGLSLVRAVMRLHGGAMRLEDSTPGLRVVLRFPKGVEGDKA
nr:HAMP domain-containing sensor histidine kinase [Rhizobiaceae bacterium]